MMKVRLLHFVLAISLFTSCSKDDVKPAVDDTKDTKETKETTETKTGAIEFAVTTYESSIPAKVGHEAIFFNNFFWIMGGSQPLTTETTNELWRSSDGISWVRVKEHAQWDGRDDFHLFQYKSKLWIVGGKSQRDAKGNKFVASGEALDRLSWKGDVWVSDNGMDWQKLVEYGPWETREGAAVGVFQDKLYLIGGQSTTNWHMYQDVYQSEDGVHWTKKVEIREEVIGTKEVRGGLGQSSIIAFKSKLYLLGGNRASGFDIFNWVLESANGTDWSVAVKDTPWKNVTHTRRMCYLRPFVFKNKLWVLVNNMLYYTDNGVEWKKQMELPLVGLHDLTSPRIVVKGDEIFIYGSFLSLFQPRDKQLHIIKLKVK